MVDEIDSARRAYSLFIYMQMHMLCRVSLDLRIAAVKSTKSTWALSSQVIFNSSRRQFFPLKPPS